jgi:hypothetical protein
MQKYRLKLRRFSYSIGLLGQCISRQCATKQVHLYTRIQRSVLAVEDVRVLVYAFHRTNRSAASESSAQESCIHTNKCTYKLWCATESLPWILANYRVNLECSVSFVPVRLPVNWLQITTTLTFILFKSRSHHSEECSWSGTGHRVRGECGL